MANPGAHRDIGNLICYAIRQMYLETDVTARRAFTFSDRELKMTCLQIVNNEDDREKFVEELRYNKNEMSMIDAIVNNPRELSKIFRMYMAKYNGSGIVSFRKDARAAGDEITYGASGLQTLGGTESNTTMTDSSSRYRLSPKIAKMLDAKRKLTNVDMSSNKGGGYSGRYG